ncbi:MAG: glycosyltransferase [Desulfobulbaceae bacterium]|nr:glycosyltransferase [Desulfobulbaceae bacterium]
MKICMFTNTYLPHVGGVARSVSAFVQDLRDNGHDVMVVAPTFPEVEAGADTKHGIYRVPALQNFNGSDFSVRLPMPYVLADTLDAFGPDLVHSHHPFLLGDTALRYARSRQLPIVFTHHTLYENYTHYVPLDSEAMKLFVINLATEYANLCRAVIAPSDSVGKILRQRGVQTQVTVVPTGVDVDFFKNGNRTRCRSRHGIDPDAVVIGHVGRLAEEKNLPFLAHAVSRVLHQSDRTQTLIVGNGDAVTDITNIFKQAGVSDKVHMTGTLEGQDLADAYQAMDLFVFASQSETQGLVLAEAMAAGLPVVALDASGVREVLVSERNGIKLDSNAAPADFAEAVADLIHDTEKTKTFCENAMQTAQEFSRRQAVQNLIDLYGDVLQQSGQNQGAAEEISVFENVQLSLKAEWELLTEKLNAAARSMETAGS